MPEARWFAARLKELQAAGVIRRAPHSRIIVYELTAYGRELELGMEVMASRDAKEGPRAFLEKRAPDFTGT